MKNLLHFLGVRLARPFYGGIGSIIALHRVIPEAERSRLKVNRALEITPEDLDAMLSVLREWKYDFIAMDDVPVRLRSGRGRFVAFTLDDGYRDNAEHAAPVFRQHMVPFTVNITRGLTEHADSTWWFALEEVLFGRDALVVKLGERVENFPLTTTSQRDKAFSTLASWIRSCQYDERKALLNAIFGPVSVDPLASTRRLILDPEGVRELARDPMATMGAHTLHHLTSSILDDSTLRVEFSASKKWLESVLGQTVKHLAYPFGGKNAVGAREFRVAQECGFLTAVTTRFSNLFPEHRNLVHQLPRLEISGNYRVPVFTERAVSGLLPALRNGCKRVLVD